MTEFSQPEHRVQPIEIPVVHTRVQPHLPRFVQQIARGEHGTESQNHIDSLIKYVTDPGLAKPREFLFDEGSTQFLDQVGAVGILNRSGFVHHVNDMRRLYEGEGIDFNTTTFAIMDVAEFRAADNAEDKTAARNNAADLVINKIGNRIQDKVTEINEQLKEKGRLAEVVVCRYGGDEFGFVFIGVTNVEARQLYEDIINADKDGVHNLDGYYLEGQVVMKKKVQTTKEEILVPEEDEKRTVFWQEFERGLLLDEKELERSMRTLERAHIPNPIDRQLELVAMNEAELRKKLDDLYERNKDLKYLTDLPQIGDQFDQRIAREVINYIEDVIYDPLLGEKVHSFHDFGERIMEDDIGEVMIFDFKGLKEVNDVLGTTAGDMVIKSMFNTISGLITEGSDETANVTYFRRGGTIVVGLLREEGGDIRLSADKHKRLKEIRTFTTGENAEFDMGASRFTFTDKHNITEGETMKTFGQFVQDAEADWYENTARWMLENQFVGILPEEPIDPETLDLSVEQLAHKERLVQLFFGNKKRYYERRDSLRDALLGIAVKTSEQKRYARELLLAIMEQREKS